MYFRKIRHPSNFRFADRQASSALHFGDEQVPCAVRDLGEDVFHVELQHPGRWPLDARLVRMLDGGFSGPSRCRLGFGTAGRLSLHSATGEPMLQGITDGCVGVCGCAWRSEERRVGKEC